MLVKFGMDTEQIVTNATNIFWMNSFISGHKKVEYIFRSHVSIAHVTVFITPDIRRANHIAVAL